MKFLQVFALTAALLWTADASAQVGLYGSPGLVRLPEVASEGQALPDYAAAPYASTGVRPAAAALDAVPTFETASAKPLGKPKKKPAAKHPPKPVPKDKVLAPPGEAPSVVDQMLDDSGSCFPPPWGPEPGCGLEEPGCGYDACCDTSCESCMPCCVPTWYVTARGLVMTRADRPNKVWVSYETDDNPHQMMHTQKDLDWRGGGEIRFGRRFCCGSYALEAAYWTLDPFTSMDSAGHRNFVSTPLDFSDVTWAEPGPPGDPVDLFDRAKRHRVWRRDEVHSVELNLVRYPVEYFCGDSFDCRWSLGLRFFRFEEDLLFGSLDEGGLAFGLQPRMEGYLDEKIENNLFGVQFGCDLGYRRNNWRLFFSPRVGLYNNHIENRFNAYRGNGRLFDTVPAGYPGYPVESTEDVFSILTEFDVGLEYDFLPGWSANIGYRVTMASGMGLADHQFPFYVVDTPEIADINDNGYLLLHGGFAGVTYQF